MKFKNKFLILSLLFSFISCDLFLDKDKGVFDKYIEKYSSSMLDSNNDTIEENSKSSQHVDLKTSKKRSKRSIVEETAEVVEPVAVLKAVVEPVLNSIFPVVDSVVEEDDDKKTVEGTVKSKETAKSKEEVASKDNKEVKEKNVKGLEVELHPNKYDVRGVEDALYWIEKIKEKKSDIMDETLAISGDIKLLKKIVSQKYKQKDKANDIMQLLDNSRQMIHNIMRSSYEYNEESFSELEANFQKVKNFLEEAIEKK
ncbi:hypothetical protein ACE4V3_06080 (plasmid) [Borrelia recurrentis]|uniref:hypothetical protein n=1 Tax=Borrelia recurrentis TaxID=44449 RepID=UPI00367032AD